MYSDKDVIVAQATPVNIRAPLAIVRVSGEQCFDLLREGFVPRTEGDVSPWRMRYGDWVDDDGVIDDVMVVCYAAPRSYTGQDMVEIFCHGAPVLVDGVVTDLVRRGARRARPGEFTMRAVLNGKMSLLQAEGVNSLIEANTRYQADLVRRQAKGPLVSYVAKQVEEILQIQAHIEATIDYGEEDIDALQRDVLLQRIRTLVDQFTRLKKTASFARSMRRGFRVLLTGEPNVGKSTLFNALVRYERAIVTSLPGTTRDLISEEIEMGGLPVVLIDSAGVRETDDEIEQYGIKKIMGMLHDVDLVLYLRETGDIRSPYPELLALPREKWLVVRTKIDLETEERADEDADIALSVISEQGLMALEKKIVVTLSGAMEGQQVYLINQRQEEVIGEVVLRLQEACCEYETGYGEEVLSSYLNDVRRLLGELTGETSVEDILDRMFSNFCLGK